MARVRVRLQPRWSDQDVYGHINNVVHARYFEEARVRTFFLGDTVEPTGLEGHFRDDRPDGKKMVVASQTIDFVRVLEYSEHPIEVELWIGRLGGSSLDLYAEIVQTHPERVVTTRCATTVVIVDGATMKPLRLTPEARRAAEAWMGEPIPVGRPRDRT